MDKRSPLVLCAAFAAALLCQNILMVSASNLKDQKNWFPLYPPLDPHTVITPPAVTYTPPPSGHSTPTPTPTPIPTPTPSHSHGTPPSHSHGSPPANCGNPPSTGGHHHSTKPSPPKGTGGGGYHHSPPTTTPTTPTPVHHSPPTTPVVVHPPSTPTPTTPTISVPPSPPSSFDPNSPPFTCNYWKNHPTMVWGIFGIWGTTIGHAFGPSSLPGSISKINLLDALSNTRTDGYGDLCKEGTAALLNSMVAKSFPYTTTQVRDSFAASLGSDKAAAAQAQIFKNANEGKTNH